MKHHSSLDLPSSTAVSRINLVAWGLPHQRALLGAMTARRPRLSMAALSSKERAICTTATLEARVDVLALAAECIASSLAGYQANEVAAVFRDGLSRHLAERG
jgi:hypothetical protein